MSDSDKEKIARLATELKLAVLQGAIEEYALEIRDVAALVKGPHGKTLRTIADQLERETLEDPPS